MKTGLITFLSVTPELDQPYNVGSIETAFEKEQLEDFIFVHGEEGKKLLVDALHEMACEVRSMK